MSYSNKTTAITTIILNVLEGSARTHQTLDREPFVSLAYLGHTARKALLSATSVHSGLVKSQMGQHVADDMFNRSGGPESGQAYLRR